VPRPAVHNTDALLDAARDLVVTAGSRAAGIRAIAERSGAPTGSLYHRFGSRDDLVAQAWLRAVRRFQAGFLAALGCDDPREGVVNAVRWAVSFALNQPADANLLVAHSRKDLLLAEPRSALAAELTAVNARLIRAVRDITRRLYGSDAPEALERVSYAIIDLPQAVLRRHLPAGTLSDATADNLASAVRALINDATMPPQARTSHQPRRRHR
jgi:AcrR family transcriptional regulator